MRVEPRLPAANAQSASPERGKIGIFNRSYYEEVLVVRAHHLAQEREWLPDESDHDTLGPGYEDVTRI